MLEGMYTAAAGMAAQQSRLDAVSNDLANASTTGYKRVRMAYRDLAYTQGLSVKNATTFLSRNSHVMERQVAAQIRLLATLQPEFAIYRRGE